MSPTSVEPASNGACGQLDVELGTPTSFDAGTPISFAAPPPGLVEEEGEEERAVTSRPRLTGPGPLSAKVRWYAPPRRKYSRRELLADRIILWGGAALSLPSAAALLYYSWSAGDSAAKQGGFVAAGLGMMTMLICSAIYHGLSWRWDWAQNLLSLDHIGISSIIMGSYVPVMQMVDAWITLTVVLSLGALGWLIEAYKFFGKQQHLSAKNGFSLLDWLTIVRYLVMGWACLAVAGPLWSALPSSVMTSYLVAGVTYSLGVCSYLNHHIEYHMPVWHLAVLVATCSVYLANWLLVGLPLPEQTSL